MSVPIGVHDRHVHVAGAADAGIAATRLETDVGNAQEPAVGENLA
jgi:hypothetical protein